MVKYGWLLRKQETGCLQWIHLGVAYPSCHFLRTACFLGFSPTLSCQSQFLSKGIPSLLWLAPFSQLLESAQGHWFFPHTPPFLHPSDSAAWCSVVVTVSSPLPAFAALCLDPHLTSLHFWCGHQLGPIKVKPFPWVSLLKICLGTECDGSALSAEVLRNWRGVLFIPFCLCLS